ncbi:MAG: 2'-5' RNA ligase family protein, partial [archaeon]|nr:2'-5' RNA ligase family protein [archaeon]
MNISIFYLIRGKPDKYIQKLIREVGPRFGERYMIEHPLPSHITLRSPFETKNVKEIEEIIRNFAKRQKPSKIEINGFGNFNRFVSFVRPILSKSALKTQKELIRELD